MAHARSRLLKLLIVIAPAMSLCAQSPDYQSQIAPLLAKRCASCHNSTKRSGGLSLATYEDVLVGGRNGAVVRPGKSADSMLLKRVTGSVEPRMPLDDEPLGAAENAVLTKWIDAGARATPKSAPAKPKWEALLSLTKPAVPAPVWPGWSNPIDRYAASYLTRRGMKEISTVSDQVFLRRAWLDIWGLLPEPKDVQAFLADKAVDKRQKLVATLLADSKKYTENWISYWNDLLRNDEGVVYYSETAQRKSISPWIYSSLETNKPFNKWIHQLLNPTDPSDPDGFLIGVNWRGTVSASQTPALQAAQNTAQIFLGINLKCNSCHDSFISKWKLKDAYSLAAFFSTEEELQLYRCDTVTQQFAKAAFLYPELNPKLPSDSAADRRAAAAATFTDPANGRMPRTVVNRVWQRLLGRGIVENVDEMDGEPWDPQLLDWLASDFVASGYDLKHLIAQILTSRVYQLPAVPQKGDPPKDYVFKGPEVRRVTAEQFADAVASITGDWHVTPGSLEFTPGRGGRGPLLVSGRPFDGSVNKANGGQAVPDPAPAAGRGGVARPPAPPPPPFTAIPAGNYTREWRLAAGNLTRALGRPIRDQVYSTRDTQAAMLQALEVVNGEQLTHWLWRGSRKLIGELPAEPKGLLARQVAGGRGAPLAASAFDLDIAAAKKLWFIVQDASSTAPDKATPLWLQAELVGADGTATPLSSLKPENPADLRDGNGPVTVAGGETAKQAVRVKFPSVIVYDIEGKGFTKLRGSTGYENATLNQGENVNGRFFIFDQKPTMDRLVSPNPATPRPAPALLQTVPEAVAYIYWFALGRAPTAGERAVAERALLDSSRPGRPGPDGVADLLWSVMMTPEFQYIR